MYSKKVIEHFSHPKNMGKIDRPDGVGKVGNVICGDVMHLYIKVGQNDVIEDIKYETFGCVAAISSSSMITEMVKGKTIFEALKIEKSSIVDSLEGLPKAKIHCSVLAIDALSESIYDYLKKNKRDIPDFLEKRHKITVKNAK